MICVLLYSSGDGDSILIVTFLAAIFGIWYIYHKIIEYLDLRKKQINALIEKPKLEQRISSLWKDVKNKEKIIEDLKKCIKEKDQLYSSFYSLNNVSVSIISEIYSDFCTLQYQISEKYLKDKKNPAFVEAKRIAELRKETRSYIEQFKDMQYKYDTLMNLFPDLVNYVEDFNAIKDLSSYNDISDFEDNVDRSQYYLTKEEYLKLPEEERNQKALNQYINGRKTNWQIGRDYEMYIAHFFREDMGCKVIEFGIDKKLEDLGRDLIATKPGKTYIVQCKHWSIFKQIHENHIAQLFGTSVAYRIENGIPLSQNGIFPVIATNIGLSPKAKEFSKMLGITVIENFPLKDFPRIKCNINGNEKIYHLPFDQQYDRTKIEKEGEFYEFRVSEAMSKGFRRALRHNFKDT